MAMPDLHCRDCQKKGRRYRQIQHTLQELACDGADADAIMDRFVHTLAIDALVDLEVEMNQRSHGDAWAKTFAERCRTARHRLEERRVRW